MHASFSAFLLPSFFSYACMHAWLGFSGGGGGAAVIDDVVFVVVVVFVFIEREEFKKNKGRERGRLAR